MSVRCALSVYILHCSTSLEHIGSNKTQFAAAVSALCSHCTNEHNVNNRKLHSVLFFFCFLSLTVSQLSGYLFLLCFVQPKAEVEWGTTILFFFSCPHCRVSLLYVHNIAQPIFEHERGVRCQTNAQHTFVDSLRFFSFDFCFVLFFLFYSQIFIRMGSAEWCRCGGIAVVVFPLRYRRSERVSDKAEIYIRRSPRSNVATFRQPPKRYATMPKTQCHRKIVICCTHAGRVSCIWMLEWERLHSSSVLPLF